MLQQTCFPQERQSLLLVLILLLGLHRRLRDSVQIPLTALCDATATLVIVLLQHADLLQRLAHLAVYRAGSVNMVGGAHAAVLLAAVDLAQAADADGLAHVDVARYTSGADVEPGRH